MEPRVRRGNRILKRPGDALGPTASVSVINLSVLEAGKRSMIESAERKEIVER